MFRSSRYRTATYRFRELERSQYRLDVIKHRGTESKNIFGTYSKQYDNWYDSENGRAIFASEVECLRPMLAISSKPWVEIGVGSGRFASSMGISTGVDPSIPMLRIAKSRGIEAIQAIGENLPFKSNTFGAILVAFTLCFVQDPQKFLIEIKRVLVPGGTLVLGLILSKSPWGRYYKRLALEGHPIYNAANFHSKPQINTLLRETNLTVTRTMSTLFQRPGMQSYSTEIPIERYSPRAGFVGIAATKIA